MVAAGLGCAARPGFNWIEPFPHVRVDRAKGAVEFDAMVMWDFHNENEPVTWLEQIICKPDSKEHESLGVTLATPSHVHAAMLLAGFEPGSPGGWMQVGTSIEPVPPTGDSLSIDIVVANSRHGGERAFPAMDWVIYEPTGQRLTEVASAKGWRFVFGGSRMGRFQGREVYHADIAGEFIGLTTFGGETVSFSEPISHEEGRQTPLFRVDPRVAPVIFTPFKVRITRAK